MRCTMWQQQQHKHISTHHAAFSHIQQPWRVHTRPPTLPSRQRTARRQVHAQVFDKFRDLVNSQFSTQNKQQNQQLDDEEGGAELIRIDTDSRGGLGGTSDVFGPLAVLVIGFLPQEYEAFRAMMLDIEADMVKIVPCTKVMLQGTLQQALESEYPQYEQPPLGQRRALFMSGMFGSEVTELIAAYREDGLSPCAFAAAVPNNWQRNVGELSEAVWRDHAAMMAKQQELLRDVEDSY